MFLLSGAGEAFGEQAGAPGDRCGNDAPFFRKRYCFLQVSGRVHAGVSVGDDGGKLSPLDVAGEGCGPVVDVERQVCGAVFVRFGDHAGRDVQPDTFGDAWGHFLEVPAGSAPNIQDRGVVVKN